MGGEPDTTGWLSHYHKVQVHGYLVSQLFTMSQQHQLFAVSSLPLEQNKRFEWACSKIPRHFTFYPTACPSSALPWSEPPLCFSFYASMPSILVNHVLPTTLRELSFLQDFEPNFLRDADTEWEKMRKRIDYHEIGFSFSCCFLTCSLKVLFLVIALKVRHDPRWWSGGGQCHLSVFTEQASVCVATVTVEAAAGTLLRCCFLESLNCYPHQRSLFFIQPKNQHSREFTCL